MGVSNGTNWGEVWQIFITITNLNLIQLYTFEQQRPGYIMWKRKLFPSNQSHLRMTTWCRAMGKAQDSHTYQIMFIAAFIKSLSANSYAHNVFMTGINTEPQIHTPCCIDPPHHHQCSIS